jgi:hypothetical protein
MKRCFQFLAALSLCATAWGQQTVTTWRWNELPPAQLPHAASLVSFGGQTALKIENPSDAPLQLTLLTEDAPKISSQVYAVQGEVREEGLRGNVFMDMWSSFAHERPSSSRAQIHAATNWVPYSVPFNSMGNSEHPTRLQIVLWIGGRGTIFLGPVKLVQYEAAQNYVGHSLGNVWLYGRTADPWWSNHTGARITNIETAILFAVGLVMGALCVKRKARGAVTLLLKIHIGIGFIFGIAAVVAIFREQPFAVWFPLLLSALILIGVYRVWLVSLGKYYGTL